MNRIIKRMAIPVGAAIILGSSGFAFMASNSVPTSYAGDGSGDIAGYTVSNVSYGDNNDRIYSISFDLDNPAIHATAFVYNNDALSGTPVRYTCDRHNTAPLHWTCVAASESADSGWADAQYLRVIAHQ